GQLGVAAATADAVVADLRAAADDANAPPALRARFAWLAVDLVASAPATTRGPARLALEKALALPSSELPRERAILERIVALEPGPRAYAQLAEALEEPQAADAALALSRVLSAAGAPGALERLELVAPTPALLESAAKAPLALEPAPCKPDQ